jgi:GT2 family glycosyltransferase
MGPVAISVAVATVSRPERLAVCLRGILNNRLLPDELVVVDQGCRPETAEVTASIASSTTVPVRHIRDDRRGLARSRNIALRFCAGDVIVVTDDDCRPDPGWLEAIASAVARHPEVAAVTGRVLADGEPGDGRATSLRPAPEPRSFQGWAPPWEVGTGANFAIRRNVALEVGGYDERLGTGSPGGSAEDIDLIHRILSAGHIIRYEPGVLLHHARETPAHRRSTRWSYGYGVGAMCGMAMRRRDGASLRALREFAIMRARLFRTGVVRMDGERVRDELTMLGATVVGLGHGLKHGRLRWGA